MFKNLSVQLIIAIILGVVVGLFARESSLMASQMTLIFKGLSPIGIGLIMIFKLISIPLVITSIVAGAISLGNIKMLGQLGTRLAIIIVGTTLAATTIGVILVSLFAPGVGRGLGDGVLPDMVRASQGKTFLDLIIPENFLASIFSGNILPIILISFILGAAFLMMKEEGRPFIAAWNKLNNGMLKFVSLVMMLAPIGVFALMAKMVKETGIEAIKPLIIYSLIVLLGLLVHVLFILPAILSKFGQYSAIKLFQRMSAALAMGFATSSSIATLPVTMHCLKNNVKASNRVVSFVCPIGAVINKNGTALYQAIAAVFIAQLAGIELGIVALLTVIVMATVAAIGAAAIPSAGLITLAFVLNAIGVPLEGIALILAVDKVLDMFRTTVNVYGDGVATVLMVRYDSKLMIKWREFYESDVSIAEKANYGS